MSYQPLLFSGFVLGQSSGGGGGSPTVGGPVVGGTAGSVLFVNPSNTLAQDPTNFNYNESTHALTITGLFSASNFSGSVSGTFSGSSSGTNTGDVTIGTANGLSLSLQVLSLGLSSTSTTGALSSTDWNTFNNKQAAGSYVLTSEVGSANGVASLDGAGKVPISQLPSSILEYEGAWNPSTNTPTLSDGTGTNGNVYYVNTAYALPVAGLTDPSMINFQVGNLIIYSSLIGKWQQTSPADGVQSINGLQGVVVLTRGNLTESVSSILTINGGTNAVWGSGTSIQVAQASTSVSGFLSSTDWNTFNNKQPAGNYANQALSNLSTTAVNANIVPIGDGNINLGNSTFRWGEVYTETVNSGSSVLSITGSGVTVNGLRIQNVANPINPQDAATKNYVDTQAINGVLTGFTSGPDSPVLATDTILQGLQKLQAQVNASPVESAGDINEMSFSAANNQSSPANVTGFSFSNAVVRSFRALVSVYINATGSLYEVFDLQGIQKGASWDLAASSNGDSSGIVFSITNAGQIQYVSSNVSGFVADTMKFRAITTSL
jgi:hypothetical protein